MKTSIFGKVLSNREISKNVWKIEIDKSFGSLPGQFFMLKVKSFATDPLLFRPFSLCNETEKSITFLYLIKGKGTNILKEQKKGDEIELIGPLGNGFEIKNKDKIALVSGGIGIAPMLMLAKKLKVKPDLYAGFSDEEFFIEEFKDHVQNIITSSEKKEGIFITEKINTDNYDVIYSCGPNGMLETLSKKNKNSKLFISMESHMACGIGACLGCSIKKMDGTNARVCKEGPVFDAKEIFG
ncbi:MAG: dihydroorotate dehydrogenase electron transfer subunit [Peptoniphilaceae bacterium]|nr:dihydroorotate dehydrogenase electron transfer subunit [Peptoniphilaceae bacterium]MDD7383015.1 dihydroorotate dehydrogenase electron transfer subunit [Peptoniphilaceae bacterium]MDY3737766.1 dihydroorotate dehydrogenase electron transfer subunit [Peptoniphilaceae bacterium]